MLKITILEFLTLLAMLFVITGALLDWYDRGERRPDEPIEAFDDEYQQLYDMVIEELLKENVK